MLHLSLFALIAVPFAAASPTSCSRPLCGVKGYNGESNAYFSDKTADLATIEGCRTKCLDDSKCKSFAVGDGACLHFTKKVSVNVVKDQNSPFTFFDRRCVPSVLSSSTLPAATSTTATSVTSSSTTADVTSSSITTDITTSSTTITPSTTEITSSSTTTADPISSAVSIISASALQPFCSSILGYYYRPATVEATQTLVLPTTQVISDGVATEYATIAIAQSTTIIHTTAVEYFRRGAVELPTPLGLQPFVPSIVTSACSIAAPSPVPTNTIIVERTVSEYSMIPTTVPTSTFVQTIPTTIIQTFSVATTFSTTTTLPTSTCVGLKRGEPFAKRVLTCPATRPVSLCCLNVAPWATNSGVWGGICGYTPSNPGELIGARCIPKPASGQCPAGTTSTCCKGTVPGQCALGTNCGAPIESQPGCSN